MDDLVVHFTTDVIMFDDKDANDLYELKFTPERAVPIVAINLTHGTGTETNRFAVATIVEELVKLESHELEIKKIDKNAFIVVNETKYVENGFFK